MGDLDLLRIYKILGTAAERLQSFEIVPTQMHYVLLPLSLYFNAMLTLCVLFFSDSSREYDPSPAKGKFHALDFDTLLKQAQQNLKR